MSGPVDVARWPDRLEAALARCDGALRRVHVVRETASTQDAARRLGAIVGDVVVAGRQTAGRGRHGRAWADTGADGVALTAVVEADDSPRAAIAGAVAAARAAEGWLGGAVRIKWPNDVMVGERKLAGVLVERSGDRARLGIGMNVNQRRWPAAIADRAVSLAEAGGAGSDIDRLDVIEALLAALDAALVLDDAALAAAFVARDWLAGRSMRFLERGPAGDRVVVGRVTRVDPFRGLAVEPAGAAGEPTWLDAAVTTVLSDDT